MEAGKTQVDVSRGQVEVASFKSGQIAQVIAGQHATAFAYGKTGLSLGGSGAFSPIEQGKPRASTVERIPVPRNGFTAPRQAANERGVQLTRQSSGHAVRPAATEFRRQSGTSVSTCSGSPTVSSAITQPRQAVEERTLPRTRRLQAGLTAVQAIATKVSAHRAAQGIQAVREIRAVRET